MFELFILAYFISFVVFAFGLLWFTQWYVRYRIRKQQEGKQ